MSANTRYILGGLAIAAVFIGGLYLVIGVWGIH